jgi:hypothetical protein
MPIIVAVKTGQATTHPLFGKAQTKARLDPLALKISLLFGSTC